MDQGVFTNHYLLTGVVKGKSSEKHIHELEKRIVKSLLRISKRHKTILSNFNGGGVLREGFYWNGQEQPIHIHLVMSSRNELRLKPHKEKVSGREYYTTNETERFSNKLVQLRIDEVFDFAGINEYTISQSKNPDIWVPRQKHFCGDRSKCEICNN